MKRFIKFTLAGLLIVAVVFIASAVIFVWQFDPNSLRDELAARVKRDSGRDLRIEGDITLTYFPWLGFEIGRVSLNDDPAFSSEPIFQVQSAGAKVKLWPLLSDRIEIGKLQLKSLHLNLIKNAEQKGNWQTLHLQPQKPETSRENNKPSKAWDISVAGIEIEDMRLHFSDRSSGQEITLSNGQLIVSNIHPNQPFAVDAGFDLSINEPALEAQIALNTEIEQGWQGEEWRVHEPKLNVTMKTGPLGPVQIALESADFALTKATKNWTMGNVTVQMSPLPGAAKPKLLGNLSASAVSQQDKKFSIQNPNLSMSLSAPSTSGLPIDLQGDELSYDNATARLQLTHARGKVEQIPIQLELQGNFASKDSPFVEGTLNTDTFVPRNLLSALGVKMPSMQGKNALSHASLKARFTASKKALQLKPLKVTLDDSQIDSSVNVALTDKKIQLDLTIDKLDADAYRAPPIKTKNGAASSNSEAALLTPLKNPSLANVNLQANIKIGQLHAFDIDSRDVSLTLHAHNHQWQVHPAEATLYGGRYQGNMQLNMNGTPQLSIDERFTDVDFGKLSQALYNVEQLSGKINGSVAMTVVGDTLQEWQRSAKGTAQYALKDGAWEGVDLAYQIESGIAKVSGQEIPPPPEHPRTKFGEFSGQLDIANAQLSGKNLLMRTPFLKLDGAGELQLIERTFDARVGAHLLKTDSLPPNLRPWLQYRIPVHVSGPLTSPQLDYGELAGELAKIWLKVQVSKKLGLPVGDANDQEIVEEIKKNAKENVKENINKEIKNRLKDLLPK